MNTQWYWLAINGASASGPCVVPSHDPPGCHP
jgi:hypothetical protein